MNGLLDAMFNLQRSEILIYQRHNGGELAMEGRGSRKREEGSFFLSALPHGLHTNWNAASGREREKAVSE